MIYLGGLIQVDQDKWQVTFIHQDPFSPVHGINQTPEELEKEGYFVEELPQAEEDGKAKFLFVNKDGRCWYEYKDIPLSIEEQMAEKDQQIKQLLKRVQESENAILTLMDIQLMGGM